MKSQTVHMKFICTGISIDKKNFKTYYALLEHLHNSKNTISQSIIGLGIWNACVELCDGPFNNTISGIMNINITLFIQRV